MSTSPNADEWTTRARSFGAVARAYDRARPSYPEAMIDDIVAAGALLPGTAAVEVGAGTGKATVQFGVRGLTLVCIEPDAAMAAVLRDNSQLLTNVDIVISPFEDFHPGRTFDAVIAAQSWHWTQPESRYLSAAALLREGGLLALFWNRAQTQLMPLWPAIDEIYRRHGVTRRGEAESAAQPPAWPGDEIEKLSTFADVEVRSYFSTQTYSALEWCDYMASTSDHLILDPEQSAAVLTEVRQVIEGQGDGALEVTHRCDLYLARRTSVPA
jgi:SAM-dependent methyltransferase